MKQVIPFLVIASHFIFSSCLNDLPETISSEIEMNTTLAFPIGKTSLGLDADSGFNEDLLQINPLTNKPYWVEYEEIPLDYSMSFEVGDIYQSTEEIIQLLFRLNIYNGFPALVRVQLYFIDTDGFPVDSVFSAGPVQLNPATANSFGAIIRKPHYTSDILFDPDRIDNLQYVDRIAVYAVFSTNGIDPDLVEFYDEYSVDVQMGVKATLKLNP
ncbi:MAG: hypothetical protein RBT49_09405 [Bacteroidales bacterium]|jgi:hypothetical protein|nr:hypothetical protein [Bacteroidales bacterium]